MDERLDRAEAGVDRWGFEKALEDFEKKYDSNAQFYAEVVLGKTKTHHVGGIKYDVKRTTREERRQFAFDKVDPLADIPDKALERRPSPVDEYS